MKMLVHRVANQTAPFDFDALKLFLRVDLSNDDATIQNMGWTAAAELEQFAQIALLNQTIRVTVFDPARDAGLRLPIGPVADDETPSVTIDGTAYTGFELVGGLRPYLRWSEGFHDLHPGSLNVEYQAGFGVAASDVPKDLAQALMDQAALLYDARSPLSEKAMTHSPHLARIGARYRGVTA